MNQKVSKHLRRYAIQVATGEVINEKLRSANNILKSVKAQWKKAPHNKKPNYGFHNQFKTAS